MPGEKDYPFCSNLFIEMSDDAAKFIERLASSLADGTFVKATLDNYKGAREHLQKALIRRIETKKGERLSFTFRYKTRDVEKNFAVDDSTSEIRKLLADEFRSGRLYTTSADLQLDISRKGKTRLAFAKPTFTTLPVPDHDRQKAVHIEASSRYLHDLGITTSDGAIRAKQQDKWRQINKFVEILASLVDKSDLKDSKQLNIVDMGSGKGYLTFAAYDYFKNVRGLDVTLTGVETRVELVELCNRIAVEGAFTGLSFVTGTIGSYDVAGVDILIALHACDTATDDALYKGIIGNAGVIVAAPCCHKELRPQIKAPPMLKDVLKYGVMMERTAETLTDGLRALLLERSGYSAKLFEFVPVEHTPKNNMLVGTKTDIGPDVERFHRQISEIKAFFGIRQQRLETLLNSQKER